LKSKIFYFFPERPSKGHIFLEEDVISFSQGSKKHAWHISEINRIEVLFNKIILALVVGGTLMSLTGVSIIKGYLGMWEGSIGITIGTLLLYYGWQGRHMLIIYRLNHQKKVISISENHQRWVPFIQLIQMAKSQYSRQP
jgi:hypothetical protein